VTIADRFDRRGEDWARFAKNVAGRFSPRFGAFRMPTHARRGLLILLKKMGFAYPARFNPRANALELLYYLNAASRLTTLDCCNQTTASIGRDGCLEARLR
jgi:hypothetical protein